MISPDASVASTSCRHTAAEGAAAICCVTFSGTRPAISAAWFSGPKRTVAIAFTVPLGLRVSGILMMRPTESSYSKLNSQLHPTAARARRVQPHRRLNRPIRNGRPPPAAAGELSVSYRLRTEFFPREPRQL